MIIKVIYGQTLMDVAIQYYGDPSALVDLANDNGLGIDADVFAGQSLLIQDTYPLSANSYYADYLAQNSIRVVSGQGGDTETIRVLATNDNEVLADNDTNAIQI
jgi:hypothetical protein